MRKNAATVHNRITEVSQSSWNAVKLGMYKVINAEGSSLKRIFANLNVQVAGKTGTAQVTSIDLENNSWFVCFAPYDNPEIAVACFIPNGYSGSEACKAPRDFIQWYLDQKELRNVDYSLPVGNSIAP